MKVSNENELNEVIGELKRGNDNGFTTVYLNTYKYVYSRAKYILHDEHEALDLA